MDSILLGTEPPRNAHSAPRLSNLLPIRESALSDMAEYIWWAIGKFSVSPLFSRRSGDVVARWSTGEPLGHVRVAATNPVLLVCCPTLCRFIGARSFRIHPAGKRKRLAMGACDLASTAGALGQRCCIHDTGRCRSSSL